MTTLCPQCGYDLSGHDGNREHRCPECGLEVRLMSIWNNRVRRDRLRRRLWRLFFVSPVVAAPGLAIAVPLYPLICFLLSAVFAYAAIRAKGPDAEQQTTEFEALWRAILSATAWTGATSVVIVASILGRA